MNKTIEYTLLAIQWEGEDTYAELDIRPAVAQRPQDMYCPRIKLSMPIESRADALALQPAQLLAQIQACLPAALLEQAFAQMVLAAQRPASGEVHHEAN